jgi:D-alanyl-D-alanine carboxypeptidase
MQVFISLLLFITLSIHAINLPAMVPVLNEDIKKNHLKIEKKNIQRNSMRNPKAIEYLLHQELQQAFPENIPGASILVLKDGHILLQRAYGLANVELNVAVSTKHLFHVASIGKQLTAAAILRLSEQGKLNLDDPIKIYFSNLPESWNDITIKHCLTHTSGIYNLFENEKFRTTAFAGKTPSQLLEHAIASPLSGAPGERFSYATVNYTLLAMIIEKRSEITYEKYIQQEFLQVLGMKNTVYDQTSGVIGGVVTPYEAGPKLAPRFHPSVGFGGGNFFSTTEDLVKWTLALQKGSVLNAANTKAMHTQFTLNNGKNIPYGYGTRPHSLAGEQYLQSNGDIPGFHSETVYLPKSKLFVAILSNGEHLRYGLTPIVKRLAVIASGKYYETVKPIKLHSNDVEKFVGNYRNEQEQYAFHRKENKLYFEFPMGAQWTPLTALSSTEFFYDNNSDFRIRFTEKTEGKHLAQWFEVNVLDGDLDPVFERIVTGSLF